ncbi:MULTISPECIES: eCIS core domain-containing protein [unclassified Geodermatophilus]|uniref:eCIS core domain-containing protein n=1 Tax=unclassified Geodermatophilus TaxID=2637632 RepID=UPI003EED97DB
MDESALHHSGVGHVRVRSPRPETGPPERRRPAERPGQPTGAAPLHLQRAVGNSGSAALLGARDDAASSVEGVVRSPGEPLPVGVRTDMEARLGGDFGDVRVHTDDAAAASARAVQASAYTVGSHIAFQRSVYDPSSDGGRATLAHELVHVLQQRSGPVDGTEGPGGIRVSHPTDRFERDAEATAARALGAPAPEPAGPADVQRLDEPSDEAPVQRVATEPEVEEPEEEPPG